MSDAPRASDETGGSANLKGSYLQWFTTVIQWLMALVSFFVFLALVVVHSVITSISQYWISQKS